MRLYIVSVEKTALSFINLVEQAWKLFWQHSERQIIKIELSRVLYTYLQRTFDE